MSDPTYPVLAIGFGAVLLISLIGIAWRSLGQRTEEPQVGRVPIWLYHPADLFGPLLLWLFWGAMIALQAFQELAKITPDGTPSDPLDVTRINAPVLLVNIALQLMLATAATGVALRGRSADQWLGLRWPKWPLVFVLAPACVLFVWAVFALIQFSGYMEWMESLGVEPMQDTVKLLMECKDPWVLGLLAFTAVIIAPVCEELVFRGYLYPILKKYAGLWPALLASSLLFGLAHGNLASLLPLCLLGALLVAAYEFTGSIWMPMAIHFCFNGATVSIQLVARALDLPLQPDP